MFGALKNPLFYGAAIGAGIGGFIGFSRKEDEDGEKISLPGRLGSAAGEALGLGFLGAGISAARTLNKGAGSMFGGVRRSAATATKTVENLTLKNRALKTIGSKPLMLAGIGAGIGALVDSDNRGRGAAIGGGIAMAASVAARGAFNWGKMSPLAKTGVKGGAIAAAAIGLVGLMSSSQQRNVESTYSPSKAEHYGGYSERLAAMQATGDMVLGMHRGRHG